MPEQAFCPKCRSVLTYVTALPHPKSTQMRKTTFVCYPCNRTWTYPLVTEIADLYAPPPECAPSLEPAVTA
jgi:RNase P subunit RPR2